MNSDGNFKMKCIGIEGETCGYYTIGKIYEVINGVWLDDDNDSIGNKSIKTIEDVNKCSSAKWELVEEISEPVKEEIPVSERMKKVANMLDLELNEEFNISLIDGSLSSRNPHKFTEHDLVNNGLMPVNGLIGALLTGKYKLEKLQWKPKDGDTVWYIFSSKCAEKNWCESFTCDRKNTIYVALYKCGWLFRTKEEAEANMERVLKEMKEVMEDE